MTQSQRQQIERSILTAIVEGILHNRNSELRRDPRAKALRERRELVVMVANEIEAILKTKEGK